VPRAVFFDSRGAIELLGSVTHRGRGAAAGVQPYGRAQAAGAWSGGVAVTARPVTDLHGYQRSLLDADDAAAAEAAAMADAFAEAAASSSGAAAAAAAVGASGYGASEAKEDEGAEEDEDADYSLDATARGWGDWSKARLHGRACVEIEAASRPGFDSAEAGLRAARGGGGAGWEDAEAVEDAVRRLLEASDAPQGAVVLCDADSGWGGVGAAVVAFLADECRGAAVLAVPVLPPWRPGSDATTASASASAASAPASDHAIAEAAAQRDAARRCTVALTWSRLSEQATAVMPLSTQAYVEACGVDNGRDMAAPLWVGDPSSPYHASALLAHALDLATTPCRASDLPSDRTASAAVTHRLRIGELCALASGSWSSSTSAPFLSSALAAPLPDPFVDPAALAALPAPPPHSTSGPWGLPLVWPAHTHAVGGSADRRSFSRPAWAAAVRCRDAASDRTGGLLLVTRGLRPPAAPAPGTARSGAAGAARSGAASDSRSARHGGAADDVTLGGWGDRWLASSGCPTARHCFAPTPLPVPLSHPRTVFRPKTWTVDGALHAEASLRGLSRSARRSLRPHVPASGTSEQAAKLPPAGWEDGWDAAAPSREAAAGRLARDGSGPETMAAMLRASCGSEASSSLRWCASALSSPDRRVLHRVLGEDGGGAAGGGGGAPEDWGSLAELLMTAADTGESLG